MFGDKISSVRQNLLYLLLISLLLIAEYSTMASPIEQDFDVNFDNRSTAKKRNRSEINRPDNVSNTNSPESSTTDNSSEDETNGSSEEVSSKQEEDRADRDWLVVDIDTESTYYNWPGYIGPKIIESLKDSIRKPTLPDGLKDQENTCNQGEQGCDRGKNNNVADAELDHDPLPGDGGWAFSPNTHGSTRLTGGISESVALVVGRDISDTNVFMVYRGVGVGTSTKDVEDNRRKDESGVDSAEKDAPKQDRNKAGLKEILRGLLKGEWYNIAAELPESKSLNLNNEFNEGVTGDKKSKEHIYYDLRPFGEGASEAESIPNKDGDVTEVTPKQDGNEVGLKDILRGLLKPKNTSDGISESNAISDPLEALQYLREAQNSGVLQVKNLELAKDAETAIMATGIAIYVFRKQLLATGRQALQSAIASGSQVALNVGKDLVIGQGARLAVGPSFMSVVGGTLFTGLTLLLWSTDAEAATAHMGHHMMTSERVFKEVLNLSDDKIAEEIEIYPEFGDFLIDLANAIAEISVSKE